MLASFLFYVYLQLYILSILFNICIYHVCYRYTLFQYIGSFSVDVDVLSRRSEAVRNHLNLLRVSFSLGNRIQIEILMKKKSLLKMLVTMCEWGCKE